MIKLSLKSSPLSHPPSAVLKFYAPWCGHCRRLEPTMNAVASRVSSDSSLSVKIGRVDGSSERALSARFGIKGFPTLFYLAKDGTSLYKIFGNRDEETIYKFITEGYKEATPVPYLESPFGPIGILKHYLMAFGGRFEDNFNYLLDKTGLPAALIGAVVGFCILFSVLIFVIGLTWATQNFSVGEGKKKKND